MNPKLSKFLQITIPLTIGVFLIWYVFSLFTPEQIDEIVVHFKNANYFYVGVAVLLSVLSHLVRAYRWGFMLEPLGYHPRLGNSFMAISIAYLMNLFIPKSGELSRAIVINKYERVPVDNALGTVIIERVVDLVLLLFFTIAALLLEFDVLYDYLVDIVPVKSLLILASILFVLFVCFLLFLKYSKSAMNLKIKKFVSGLKDGILTIFKMKKKWPFIFHSILIWLLYITSFYIATLTLEETSTIAMGTLIICFVVGSFSFAFTNSGFGSYPAAIMAILLVFGIDKELGFAFGWIVWTSNIAYILIAGGLSFLLLPFYNRAK